MTETEITDYERQGTIHPHLAGERARATILNAGFSEAIADEAYIRERDNEKRMIEALKSLAATEQKVAYIKDRAEDLADSLAEGDWVTAALRGRDIARLAEELSK